MSLRLALVGGPMYDQLYDRLPPDVEVVVHADHPTLNRRVAEMLSAGERIDLLSTHSKYAPSQARWLRPLDHLVPRALLAPLAPAAVDLCRFRGRLLCVPRNIDVRVLWFRTDLVAEPPDTWAAMLDSPHAFGFPGRESGLFGTFYELVVGHGGRLFDERSRPVLQSAQAERAIEILCALARKAPADLHEWHYDEVDDALLAGRVAMAATWPGGFDRLARSPLYDRLAPAPYPAGPHRRVSYAGCHAWSIPSTCAEPDAALALLIDLCSQEASAIDARGGSVCAHERAFAGVRPRDESDRRRLEITRQTIAQAMITYPPLARFPEIEDGGWAAIRAALRGERTPAQAIGEIQRLAEHVLAASD